MPPKSIGVARGKMFIRSKSGQNISEMEVRTFVRIQKITWDHLLASKAGIILKQALFSFPCRTLDAEWFSACYAVCSVSSFVLFYISATFVLPLQEVRSKWSVNQNLKHALQLKENISSVSRKDVGAKRILGRSILEYSVHGSNWPGRLENK